MADKQDKFKMLTESFNKIGNNPMRGVDAFCALLQIQSELRVTHNLDPAHEGTYQSINTTLDVFNHLLSEKYLLAARQLYEGAGDQAFLNAKRPISEALSDLHLVPVYIQLSKETVGNKEPLAEADWQKIGVTSKSDYDSLVSRRLTNEAKRVWDMAKEWTGDYSSFANAVHETGLLLRRAGLNPDEEKTFLALGTTHKEFNVLLAQRLEKEQAAVLPLRRLFPLAKL